MEITDEQLKVRAYNLMRGIEQAKMELEAINKEIARREQAKAQKPKEPKTVKKKG